MTCFTNFCCPFSICSKSNSFCVPETSIVDFSFVTTKPRLAIKFTLPPFNTSPIVKLSEFNCGLKSPFALIKLPAFNQIPCEAKKPLSPVVGGSMVKLIFPAGASILPFTKIEVSELRLMVAWLSPKICAFLPIVKTLSWFCESDCLTESVKLVGFRISFDNTVVSPTSRNDEPVAKLLALELNATFRCCNLIFVLSATDVLFK